MKQFFISVIIIFLGFSCGVKAPPLPPLETTAQDSEPQPSPRPSEKSQ